MTDLDTRTAARPVVITVAVVLVYLSGFLDVGAGLLVLLSRYQTPGEAVLAVSLLGAAIILFGLLSIAIGSGVARGSRLARLLLTVYAVVRLALHVVTIVTTDWDWSVATQIVASAFVVVVLWTPPGTRFFRSGIPLARA